LGLNRYLGTGKIGKVTFKELEQEGGTLQICSINVPINHWTPGRGGQEGREETLWFELAQFHHSTKDAGRFNMAEKWRDTYQDRDDVWISGKPTIRTYMKSDGTPGVAIKLNDPEIGHTAKRAEVVEQQLEQMPF